LFDQIVRDRERKLQSLEPGFDDDFPATGVAEKQLVRRIFEVRPVLRRQPRVVGNDPQEDVGVEKDFHRPNGSRIASGSLWQWCVKIVRDYEIAFPASHYAAAGCSGYGRELN
jgi:hypothetical protein